MLATTLILTAMHAALVQGGSRTIKGTVVDSADHKPVAKAVIYLGRWSTAQRTGDEGRFRVSAPADRTLIMVRLPGYVPAVVVVAAGDSGSEMDLGTTTLLKGKTDADRAEAQNADILMYPELAQIYDHKAKIRQRLCLHPVDLHHLSGSRFSTTTHTTY